VAEVIAAAEAAAGAAVVVAAITAGIGKHSFKSISSLRLEELLPGSSSLLFS
jgi:hypothetical protein